MILNVFLFTFYIGLLLYTDINMIFLYMSLRDFHLICLIFIC
jgi:hypothetical protein